MMVLKKVSLVILLLFLMTSFISAGSLGMSPSSFKFNFEPGLEETVVIRVADSDLEQPIAIYVSGDLSQYVNVSAKNFTGVGILEVKIKLPKELDRPGNHRIIIGSREEKNVTASGTIGGVSAIQVPIDIFVPYPGKYAEAEFSISNANEKEPIPYRLAINNLGTQAINFSYDINIFSDFSNSSSLINIHDNQFLEANKKMTIEEMIYNSNLKPGNYRGFAKINYGSDINLNSSFKIGTFLINITDYNYEFISGKINPFKLSTISFWNSEINETYAEVSVTDSGIVRSYFKSSSYSFKPLEEKEIIGYIDATNITPGRYVGNIILSYDGKINSKLVAFYFVKPEMTKTEKLLYLAGGVLILFLIIIVSLLVEVFILRKRRSKR